MALADVLRERVSRRGRTAEVACGLLGTVTVEALPPRECAALGLRDGGRKRYGGQGRRRRCIDKKRGSPTW